MVFPSYPVSPARLPRRQATVNFGSDPPLRPPPMATSVRIQIDNNASIEVRPLLVRSVGF